jgi:YVTN family beta-propeller protein
MNWKRSLRAYSIVLLLVAAACAVKMNVGSSAPSAPHASTSSPSTSSHPGATTGSLTTRANRLDPLTGAGPGVNVYSHTTAGRLSPKVRGVPTRVYVPNSLSNTVDVIDPTSFRVIAHYPVGDTPQHVVPSYDLTTLYVNNNRGNSLTPIDPRTGLPGTAIAVDDPYNLYFTPDGTRAIVMAERNSRVDFRDPKSFELIKSVPIAHAGVNHADFTPNGKVMIASCEFSGWIVRIDVTSMTVTGELKVGGMPVDVKSSPDGTVMFVANQGRGGVSIVDPVKMREIGFIATGAGAHGLSVSRDGTQMYVTNRLAGSISVIDFATRRVVATWRIGGSPDMGGVSADGKQFWVSGRYNSSVYVIDTTSGKLLATIPVGRGPHGLALFPQPGRFSMGHTGNYR